MRNGLVVKLERQYDGQQYLWHPDDIIRYTLQDDDEGWTSSGGRNTTWEDRWKAITMKETADSEVVSEENARFTEPIEEIQDQVVRRSRRVPVPNRRYIDNEQFEN